MTPTPIHSWKLPGVPDGFDVSIKREDMIGSTLSGNKVKCVCVCVCVCVLKDIHLVMSIIYTHLVLI